jgi:CzcA family heavy metal efflux pump
MIRGIIGWSLQYRFLVVILAVVLVVFGITQANRMPVDVLPEFSPPYVEIQTEALGLSAEEVEQLITVPMEQDLLSGVAWLDTIRSESVPGMSSIVVFFEPGTDLMQARQMVSERLTQAVALPHVSKPPTMLQPLSSSSRFIIVGLSSKTVSPIQMSVLARWTVGPRLMGVPGVSNVAIWGQRDRQLQVQAVPERLRAHDVTLQQVLETTGNALWVSSLSFLEASTPGTGGFIDTPQQRLGIWHVSPISSAAELAQVAVEGTPLRLGDVARVVEDHQPLIGDAMANDNPSLLLVIEKLPGTNTLDVTRGVEAALDAMRPGLGGIDINTTLFRPATYIETAMGNLSRTLLIGAVLAILALALFLFSWRTVLVSVAAMVLSLMASLVVLYLRGATLNAIVLVGLFIALGVIVDDAIIDTENIARRLRQLRKEGSLRSTLSIVLDSSYEMRSPMAFATLLLLLFAVPIFFIEGVSGAFFQPLAASYALAVFVSMVVALVVTPALCMILLPGRSDAASARDRSEPPLARWLKQLYDRILAPVMRSSRLAWVGVAVLLVVGLATLPLLMQQSQSQSLLPTFKEPDVLVSLTGAPGTSHPAMVRIANQTSRELGDIPGVRNVGAHVGRAVFGDQVVGINSAKIWVNIDPAADYGATVSKIQEIADGYPGIQPDVLTYLKEKSSVVTAGGNGSMTVRVFGENLDVLKSQAETVRQAIAGVNGVADPQLALPVEEPTVEIEVDLAKAERYGIKPGDVRRAAATMLSGLQVGMLFEDQKVFDVVVWSTPETRQSLTNIRELLIDTPGGGRVRLQDVADVRVASSPNVIHRESISPYIDVTFTAQGRDRGAIAADLERAVKGIQFPLEYHAEVLGGYAEQQAMQQRILLAVVIALVGAFLFLQAVFDSWRVALLAFLSTPLALAGGLLAALATGNGIVSLGVLAGLLLVFSIAIRNCISLVSHYQHLRKQEGEPFGPGLVLRGSRERVVPILLTALVTALIFAPFIVFGSVAGQEIEHPMAIVVLGGLVTSTVLNLFIVPALYLRFGYVAESVEEISSPAIPAVPAK